MNIVLIIGSILAGLVALVLWSSKDKSTMTENMVAEVTPEQLEAQQLEKVESKQMERKLKRVASEPVTLEKPKRGRPRMVKV